MHEQYVSFGEKQNENNSFKQITWKNLRLQRLQQFLKSLIVTELLYVTYSFCTDRQFQNLSVL